MALSRQARAGGGCWAGAGGEVGCAGVHMRRRLQGGAWAAVCAGARVEPGQRGMHHYFPAPAGPPPPISQFLSPDSPFPDYF